MCTECGWEETVAEVDELLEDDKYEWANETLAGIGDTITDKKHVTERQVEAIQNIQRAVKDR